MEGSVAKLTQKDSEMVVRLLLENMWQLKCCLAPLMDGNRVSNRI